MENKKEMRQWLVDFGLNHPLVIGGPCSAETEEQVLKIAHELKESDVIKSKILTLVPTINPIPPSNWKNPIIFL